MPVLQAGTEQHREHLCTVISKGLLLPATREEQALTQPMGSQECVPVGN